MFRALIFASALAVLVGAADTRFSPAMMGLRVSTKQSANAEKSSGGEKPDPRIHPADGDGTHGNGTGTGRA